MTLTEFLTARFDEDEKAARAAARAAGYHWSPDPKPGRDGAPSIDRHQARHDPARVLAECKAKRQIIGHLAAYGREGIEDFRDGYAAGMWDALRFLAQPYAEHPDYLPEWRL